MPEGVEAFRNVGRRVQARLDSRPLTEPIGGSQQVGVCDEDSRLVREVGVAHRHQALDQLLRGHHIAARQQRLRTNRLHDAAKKQACVDRHKVAGLRQCVMDLRLTKGYVIANTKERYAIGTDIDVVPWTEVVQRQVDFGLGGPTRTLSPV